MFTSTQYKGGEKGNFYPVNDRDYSWKFVLPKDLELTTENIEKENAKNIGKFAYTNRDTGEVTTVDAESAGNVEDIVQSGTFDAQEKDIADFENETVLILDVMAMSKSKFKNRWFLALCADPEGDGDDENSYFTLPFGGVVATEKIKKLAGYNSEFERDDTKVNHLPKLAKIIKIQGSDTSKNPYTDLVAPNTK